METNEATREPACLSDDALKEVEAEAPEILAELDGRGLFPAPDETGAEFAKRLRTLRTNLADLEKRLETEGAVSIAGLLVKQDTRIPPEVFEEGANRTEPLYGIRVDWVPGFFINPKMSWLFGGCAFYQYPDWLALFIIRRSFARSSRWMIYTREELLAHELCHVARVALNSRVFEEHFAYLTSESRFRRTVGPIVRHPWESFALLGSCLLLLAAQVVRVLIVPTLPILPFWCLPVVVLAVLATRLRRERLLLQSAMRNLDAVFPGYGRHAAFRLSDAEIEQVASASSPQETEAILPADLRPRILHWRFGKQSQNENDGAASSSESSPPDPMGASSTESEGGAPHA